MGSVRWWPRRVVGTACRRGRRTRPWFPFARQPAGDAVRDRARRTRCPRSGTGRRSVWRIASTQWAMIRSILVRGGLRPSAPGSWMTCDGLTPHRSPPRNGPGRWRRTRHPARRTVVARRPPGLRCRTLEGPPAAHPRRSSADVLGQARPGEGCSQQHRGSPARPRRPSPGRRTPQRPPASPRRSRRSRRWVPARRSRAPPARAAPRGSISGSTRLRRRGAASPPRPVARGGADRPSRPPSGGGRPRRELRQGSASGASSSVEVGSKRRPRHGAAPPPEAANSAVAVEPPRLERNEGRVDDALLPQCHRLDLGGVDAMPVDVEPPVCAIADLQRAVLAQDAAVAGEEDDCPVRAGRSVCPPPTPRSPGIPPRDGRLQRRSPLPYPFAPGCHQGPRSRARPPSGGPESAAASPAASVRRTTFWVTIPFVSGEAIRADQRRLSVADPAGELHVAREQRLAGEADEAKPVAVEGAGSRESPEHRRDRVPHRGIRRPDAFCERRGRRPGRVQQVQGGAVDEGGEERRGRGGRPHRAGEGETIVGPEAKLARVGAGSGDASPCAGSPPASVSPSCPT